MFVYCYIKNGLLRYMTHYEEKVYHEMYSWKVRVSRPPTTGSKLAKGVQHKMNDLIPEKVHQIITLSIEKMVKAVLFGSTYTTSGRREEGSLQLREAYVKRVAKHYRNVAMVEGAITGAGGILMGFADFPAFLAIKIKLLFEIATIYGYDIKNYKERLFMLYLFKMAFSSRLKQQEILEYLVHWQRHSQTLPDDLAHFDWRDFQLEYRDYIDLAKMAQLIPFVGAAVGIVANKQLTQKLVRTAMNGYRLRYFSSLE